MIIIWVVIVVKIRFIFYNYVFDRKVIEEFLGLQCVLYRMLTERKLFNIDITVNTLKKLKRKNVL